jgi:hypothetical protein
VAAKDRLAQRLHQLNREVATLNGPGGLFAGLSLIGYDPGVVSWFTFRARALTTFFKHTHALTEALTRARGRQVKLGIGPRMPAFSALCGYDFPAIAPMFDLILPKLYFWHRGFDGLYGTVSRYVETLTAWNPGLSERGALRFVTALFGIDLPGIGALRDFDLGFPQAFFDHIVTRETERAIAAMGDPERVCPWVDAGRKPHDGEPFTAHDLDRLLEAAQTTGLRRFLYHHHGNLTPGEWAVITARCGQPWQHTTTPRSWLSGPQPEALPGYYPPDQPVL